MDIPRHWVRARGQARIEGRGDVEIAVWGWSSDDERAARELAERRLRDTITRLDARLAGQGDDANGYPRERLPVREEIVREIRVRKDRVHGLVTRTGYGSLVLNCERALFIDVDLPRPNPFARRARALGLVRDDPAARVFDRLRAALAERNESFRLYRTAAGFRALATEREYDPGSAETQDLMKRVRADVAFARLCRMQQSFRARLTPKPWRCGVARAPGSHPREAPEERARFADWRGRYDAACAAVATCRLEAQLGSGRVHADIAPLLDVHDELTRTESGLPLA